MISERLFVCSPPVAICSDNKASSGSLGSSSSSGATPLASSSEQQICNASLMVNMSVIRSCTSIIGDLYLANVRGLPGNVALSSLSMISGNLVIANMTSLLSVKMESLREVGGTLIIQNNSALTSVQLPNLARVGSLSISRNTRLSLVGRFAVSSMAVDGPILALRDLASIGVSQLASLGISCSQANQYALYQAACNVSVNPDCPGFRMSVSSTCTSPALCPAGSIGVSVPAGCPCMPGFQGSIQAIENFPFYRGSCLGMRSCCSCSSNLV